jgi:hypothetical protein
LCLDDIYYTLLTMYREPSIGPKEKEIQQENSPSRNHTARDALIQTSIVLPQTVYAQSIVPENTCQAV